MAQSTPYGNTGTTGSSNPYAGSTFDPSYGDASGIGIGAGTASSSSSSTSSSSTASSFGSSSFAGSLNPLQALSRHLGELSHETMTLLRQEVELAKAEGRETAKHVGAGVGEIAVGGGVAMCGFLVLLGAAVAGLANIWPVWLSALVVGGVTLAIGLMLASRAREHLNAETLRPTETLAAARDTKQRVKESFR